MTASEVKPLRTIFATTLQNTNPMRQHKFSSQQLVSVGGGVHGATHAHRHGCRRHQWREWRQPQPFRPRCGQRTVAAARRRTGQRKQAGRLDRLHAAPAAGAAAGAQARARRPILTHCACARATGARPAAARCRRRCRGAG